MNKEYKDWLKLLDELKDIEDDDDRCDLYNETLDKAIAYEDENNICPDRSNYASV